MFQQTSKIICVFQHSWFQMLKNQLILLVCYNKPFKNHVFYQCSKNKNSKSHVILLVCWSPPSKIICVFKHFWFQMLKNQCFFGVCYNKPYKNYVFYHCYTNQNWKNSCESISFHKPTNRFIAVFKHFNKQIFKNQYFFKGFLGNLIQKHVFYQCHKNQKWKNSCESIRFPKPPNRFTPVFKHSSNKFFKNQLFLRAGFQTQWFLPVYISWNC